MFTLLLSLAVGVVVFAIVAALLSPIAAILPAILASTAALVVALMRIKNRVDADMEGVVPLLQARKIAEGVALLERVRVRWGRWMPLLSGQIDAQLGMLEFYQLKYDAALPLLIKGSWRNWMGLVCIGVIHHKRGRLEDAWTNLEKAVAAGRKEPLAYAVFAVLLVRSDDRDRALAVLERGVKAAPESKELRALKDDVANKRKPDTARFGQAWFQFFPDELAAQMGANTPMRMGPGPGPGFRPPKMSKAQRRGR